MGKGRMGWIEWARALGACGVVLLHVFVSTVLAVEVGTARLVSYATLGIVFGRWAVPSFFMITGYLLLDGSKHVGWREVRRYVMRMAAVLATFGLAFALLEELWMGLSDPSGLSLVVLWRAVVDVATARTWDHLWYVYALLGVYVFVPSLRAMQARVGKRGFAIFTVVLCAVVLVVPTFARLWVTLKGGEVYLYTQGFAAWGTNVAIGVANLCVGSCLRDARLNWKVAVCGTLSLCVMLLVSLWGILGGHGDCGFVFLQGSCFSCAYAVFVLMLLRRFEGDAPVRSGSLVERLANDSFGIYVLHPLFVHAVLLGLGAFVVPSPVFEALLFCVSLGGSVLLTHVVRFVPRLGKLL